ncbi:23S rRNA pseudouridine955/2504/2580 synthase [Sphingomonas kaistensis]|uniref:23S rRNA pseudouridine955/2504/2580 synthase n=1 Tax=Sphingomonas kaistensis TaxID=298708 RepID=A0A7X6BFC5_9SPHN|nr:RluA family pseudouridine synthase [Sphingomonas kaistensis]NJC05259.1 23S rRNA pseudouridine955/2504/2580 synthase [Sphingomonas kaistensis]
MSTEHRTFTVAADDDGIRLDRWFKRHMGDEVSFNLVSRWARTGQLRVNGEKATPGDRIEAGQTIRIPPRDAQPARSDRPSRVLEPLTDDERSFVQEMVIDTTPDAFVLNKPPGLATQGGTKTDQHLDRLLDGLADEEGNRPKLVHRLDKDTSGVLLVARSARSAAFFSKSFAGRTARKVYWAVVVGDLSQDEGLIDAPLAKQPGTGGEKMHVAEDGQAARTRFRVIDRAGTRAAFVELQPQTGRTHQLRAHMAHLGHPIVGDAKYGGADAFLTGGVSRKLHLHARRLKIDAPGGKEIDTAAELPAHFAETLATLGFEARDGENMPLDRPDPAKSAEVQFRRKAAAAKTARKERKGERRGRGAASAPAKPTRSKGPPAKGPPAKGPPRGRK